MKLKSLSGYLVNKNVSKYRMDWECKERSKPQLEVKQFLKQYWANHIVYREFPVYGSKMKIDIFNATKMIAIEIDGEQHDEYNPFFHGNRFGWVASLNRDDRKQKWCDSNKITLCRVFTREAKDLTFEFFQEKFGIALV